MRVWLICIRYDSFGMTHTKFDSPLSLLRCYVFIIGRLIELIFLIGKLKSYSKTITSNFEGICVSSFFGLFAFGIPETSICLPICPMRPVLEKYRRNINSNSTEIEISEIQNENYHDSSQGSHYAQYGAEENAFQ